MKSVLRRVTGAPAASGPRVRMGRVVLDLEKRVLVDPANGGEDALTASEFDLLKLFAENPNRPLQRDWLLESAAHREAEAFDLDQYVSLLQPGKNVLAIHALNLTADDEDFLIRTELSTQEVVLGDRKSTRLNSSHMSESRMPSSA